MLKKKKKRWQEQRQEAELEVAEIKPLWFSWGVTRMDRIGKWGHQRRARCFGDEDREARLRWFGHLQRRGGDYVGGWSWQEGGLEEEQREDLWM